MVTIENIYNEIDSVTLKTEEINDIVEKIQNSLNFKEPDNNVMHKVTNWSNNNFNCVRSLNMNLLNLDMMNEMVEMETKNVLDLIRWVYVIECLIQIMCEKKTQSD